jgi:hypothetical protein
MELRIPFDQQVHVIIDNYGTHKHPLVKRWLGAIPAIPFPFHTDQFFLAQSGAALVSRIDGQAYPPQ